VRSPARTYQSGTSFDDQPIDSVAEAGRLRNRWHRVNLFGRAADRRKIEVLLATRGYLRAARAHRGWFQAMARAEGIKHGYLETRVLRFIHAMPVRSSRTPVGRFGKILGWMADQSESDADLLERLRSLNLSQIERLASAKPIDHEQYATWYGVAANGTEWFTPAIWFKAFGIKFDLDVAAPSGGVSWVPATRYFTKEDDGLAQEWSGLVFCNAPYSEMERWVDKFVHHANGIMLVPDNTSTKWFQTLAANAEMILFVNRKIKFLTPDGEPGHAFPRGTAFVAMGEECVRGLIRAHRAGLGMLMTPPLEALIARYEEPDVWPSVAKIGEIANAADQPS
jgi:hypothetical protein